MKNAVILVLALLAILGVNYVQDYLERQQPGKLDVKRDQVAYYLANFSLLAIDRKGEVSYRMAGRHLAHWQKQQQSIIVAPLIEGRGSEQQRMRISADEALMNHASNQAEALGHVQVLKPEVNGEGGFELKTDHLTYDVDKRQLATEALVQVVGSAGTMQARGMTAKLDEGYLRLNADVRASYEVH